MKRNNRNIFVIFVFWKDKIKQQQQIKQKQKKANHGYTKYRQNTIYKLVCDVGIPPPSLGSWPKWSSTPAWPWSSISVVRRRWIIFRVCARRSTQIRDGVVVGGLGILGVMLLVEALYLQFLLHLLLRTRPWFPMQKKSVEAPHVQNVDAKNLLHRMTSRGVPRPPPCCLLHDGLLPLCVHSVHLLWLTNPPWNQG